jgi:hypothetical protein
MGRGGWREKFIELCQEISTHVQRHPLPQPPAKRRSRPFPQGWAEQVRPSGPIPALPRDWHEPAGQAALESKEVA